MKKPLSFVVVLIALCCTKVYGQGSWSDNFNSGTLGTGWYQTGQYSLKAENSQLTVNVNKSSMWASFGVNITSLDVRTKPILNVKVKTATPFLFTCYLVSASGNVLVTIPVMASNNFNNLSFDFTGKDVNNNVLNAVTSILFCVNGDGLSWSGTYYMDDVMLGNAAIKLADVSSVGDQVFFQGKTGCKVFLRGISNAASLSLTGAGAYIQNISFDPIAADGTTWMKFDCKPAVSGTAIATLTANPAAGYTANSVNFSLEVEGNKNPTIDAIADVQASKSVEKVIDLTGIGDGNAAAEQTVTVTATSGNIAVTDNPTVVYTAGSKYATLKFTPKAAGTAVITVTLNDGQTANNITTKTFTATVLDGWNNAPTIDNIPNKEVLNTAGQQTINLTGISDGDGTAQTLTFTAVSSDPTIIPNPTVQYTSGNTGTMKYTPVAGKTGFVTITLTVADNGGNANNNGNQSKIISFKIEAYSSPLTGYVVPFTGTTPNAFGSVQPALKDYWHVEDMGVTQTVSYATDGADKVLKIVCNSKSTWEGSWYYTPDMDLTDYPLISMWVKSDQTIKFHLYFWDDSIRNNEDHHLEYTCNANTWTKLNFDFSDPTGMNNGAGKKVNAKRIKRVLFNYHPAFGWPFTIWSGTVMFKDIRIGDQSGITPTYYCTVDAVGPQTYFMDSNPKTIKLTGITRGKDNVATVAVAGKGVVKSLSVSSVVNGEATITCTPSTAGIDTITVTVTGAAIGGKVPVAKVMKIPVSIVNKTTATPSVPTFNLTQLHQTYRGLGAVDPGEGLIDLYTTGAFGATEARFGMFDENQVEPVNDNGDPNTLDRSKLNYNAFDWDHIRNLKARGVETFFVTIFTPPAWMKENMSTNYQQAAAPAWGSTTNRVMTAYYDEYAELAVAIATMFKEEAGVTLTAIGMQNEPAFCEPYASAVLDPDHFAQIIALVGQRFAALGITTKLFLAEQVGVKMSDGPVYSQQNYLDAVNANATAKTYNDIFAIHGYGSDGVSPGVPPGSTDWANTYTAVNTAKSRELWMTETEPPFATWDDAFVNAANILTAFESGNVSLWSEWSWNSHCISKGQPTQKLWAQSMFQYIKPGAVRATSTSGHTDILMTTWKNDVVHSSNYVIVIMNKGTSALTLNINNASLPADFTVFRCSENVPRFQDSKYVKGDKLLLAPRSIVTLVSGLKATPTINQVASQLIMNDGNNKTINLSGITDGNPTNQNAITVNYTSSNPAVLTNMSLAYTSPNTTGTFNYKPLAVGITQITVNVTASGVTTTMKFNIEVKDYSVPNINPVTVAKSYDLGTGTKTISLAGINDGDNGTQIITVTAPVTTSAPAGVISTPVVTYTSPQSTGSISFTPLKVGTAEITITVTDNGPAGKNTTTYKVTIVVIEHFKPTIAVINDTTVAYDKFASIPIKITNGGDKDSITSVTATSSDTKILGFPSVPPTHDRVTTYALEEGTATITVTVTDNGPAGNNTATRSFKVTVKKNGISLSDISDEVLIYPNPVAEQIHIEISNANYDMWKIATSNGMLVKEGKIFSSQLDVDLSDLSSGSYMLIFENGNSSRIVKQFMKR